MLLLASSLFRLLCRPRNELRGEDLCDGGPLSRLLLGGAGSSNRSFDGEAFTESCRKPSGTYEGRCSLRRDTTRLLSSDAIVEEETTLLVANSLFCACGCAHTPHELTSTVHSLTYTGVCLSVSLLLDRVSVCAGLLGCWP